MKFGIGIIYIKLHDTCVFRENQFSGNRTLLKVVNILAPLFSTFSKQPR